MKNSVVIYFSNTGNTEIMANAVANGMKQNPGDVKVIAVKDAKLSDVESADFVALGCPAMGVEELDDSYMEPFVDSLSGLDFSNKKFALFGSYDWGEGQWIEDWQEKMEDFGVDVIGDGLMVQGEPEVDGLTACGILGKTLTEA